MTGRLHILTPEQTLQALEIAVEHGGGFDSPEEEARVLASAHHHLRALLYGNGREASPEWDPDWCVAPGAMLADWIEESGLTIDLTAKVCAGIPASTLRAIVAGEQPLTEPIAAALERGTGIPRKIWLNLELAYRAGLARGKAAW